MTAHQGRLAFPISSAASQPQARSLVVKRMPYSLADDEDSRDLIALDPDTGDVIEDILFLGRVFHYDPNDTTTAHDGTTCLLSHENYRYKLATGVDVLAWSVLDILTVPPDDPSAGDAYLVDDAATGDWSGKDGKVAIYTARGWEYVEFGVGRLLYVQDENSFYHRKNDGTWEAGLGSQVLGANTVKASSLIGQPVRWIVENQTTNAPPGSPSTGDAYIIGSSPTGAWGGKATQIAIYEGAAWGYYVPRDGELAYDKATKIDIRYDSDVLGWASAVGAVVNSKTTGVTISGSTTTGGSGVYSYSSSTPPTTSQNYIEDSVYLDYTAKKAGSVLKFIYNFNAGNANNLMVGLFKDDISNAIAWGGLVSNIEGARNSLNFEIIVGDTEEHTYKVRIINISGGTLAAPTRRSLRVEEFA